MKNILILGLTLCMGVSLSSCENDDEVRPMSITPAGTMDVGDNDEVFPSDDLIDDQDDREDDPTFVDNDGLGE